MLLAGLGSSMSSFSGQRNYHSVRLLKFSITKVGHHLQRRPRAGVSENGPPWAP